MMDDDLTRELVGLGLLLLAAGLAITAVTLLAGGAWAVLAGAGIAGLLGYWLLPS